MRSHTAPSFSVYSITWKESDAVAGFEAVQQAVANGPDGFSCRIGVDLASQPPHIQLTPRAIGQIVAERIEADRFRPDEPLQQQPIRRINHEDQKRRKTQLQSLVRDNVEAGSALYSDALKSYDGLSEEYKHQVVDHAIEYVRENVHTNGMENFWSLLKRSLKGTYVSVDPVHLFRYLDEQAFRFNERKDCDSGRFLKAAKTIEGALDCIG